MKMDKENKNKRKWTKVNIRKTKRYSNSKFPLSYLPALQKQTPVDSSEPHYRIARLEVPQLSTSIVQKHAQALEKLRCRGL